MPGKSATQIKHEQKLMFKGKKEPKKVPLSQPQPGGKKKVPRQKDNNRSVISRESSRISTMREFSEMELGPDED